jgi:hypothetical protein
MSIIVSLLRVTLDGVLDCILDLLTTYTHDSWVLASTLTSALYSSLKYTLNLLSLLCLYQSFPGNGYDSANPSTAPIKSSLHRLTYSWIQLKSKTKWNLRLAVYRQSVRPGIRPLETHDQIFFNSTLAVIVLILHPSWWGYGSIVYNCCCPSTAQSFSGLSPTRPVTVLYCLKFETPPNLEGQVPVFISSRNRASRLYPRALGSLFVTSYDSLGYGGGMQTRLHKGETTARLVPSLYKPLGTDRVENTVSNIFFIVSRGLLGFPRDRCPASPKARWLLPDKGCCLVICFAIFA